MKIRADFFKKTGKWQAGGEVEVGEVEVGEARLHDRIRFLQAVLANQNILVTLAAYSGGYYLVTNDLPDDETKPSQFSRHLFFPEELFACRPVGPHTARASQITGKPESEVTPEERRVGKIDNFAQVYGGGSATAPQPFYMFRFYYTRRTRVGVIGCIGTEEKVPITTKFGNADGDDHAEKISDFLRRQVVQECSLGSLVDTSNVVEVDVERIK